MTDKTTLELARNIAIDILNDMHSNHGINDVMKCNFCTSKASEMMLARAIVKIQEQAKTEMKERCVNTIENKIALYSFITSAGKNKARILRNIANEIRNLKDE